MSSIDTTLADMTETWERFARYRVVVSAPRSKGDAPIATALTLTEARALESAENARIKAEHPELTDWTRPMAAIELENADEAQAAYRKARGIET